MIKSKIDKALDSLKGWQGLMACPVCGGAVEVQGASLRCERGHNWDVNRKGYVNLLSRPHETYYDKSLFEARRRLFEAGVYNGVAQGLSAYIQPGQRVLDAGCGEGFYLDHLAGEKELLGAGVDISRDAIVQAACHERPQLWLVGDITRLPFRPQSLDVILDILTPASYQAFKNVLKPGGLLLKVYPAAEYLKELRSALGMPAYEAGSVEDYARQNARVIGREEIHQRICLTPEMYRDFVWMTPLTQRLTSREKERLAARPQEKMTLHLQLAVMEMTD